MLYRQGIIFLNTVMQLGDALYKKSAKFVIN